VNEKLVDVYLKEVHNAVWYDSWFSVSCPGGCHLFWT